MDHTALTRILETYHLTPVSFLPCQKGYRNKNYGVVLADGRTINLIIYKSGSSTELNIRRAHTVASALANALPVRLPITSRLLCVRRADYTNLACIYTYLPGHTIAWEAYTRAHLKLLGAAMGTMHATLAPAGRLITNPVAEQYIQTTDCMQRYFRQPGVISAMRHKLGVQLPGQPPQDLRRILGYCRYLPGQQALHMDFVRGNILFDNKPQVTGIIDFEKAAYGHPVFDIARTLAFLLVDCKYTPAAKIRKYFLHSGYRKRSAMTYQRLVIRKGDERIDVLESLLDLFLLYDFYKFLRHNPYEALAQNEHFVRTRNLLLARGQLVAGEPAIR